MEIVQTVPNLTEAEKQLHHSNETIEIARAYPGTRSHVVRSEARRIYLTCPAASNAQWNMTIMTMHRSSAVLLGEPYGTPIPRQRCCCRSCAGCTADTRRAACGLI